MIMAYRKEYDTFIQNLELMSHLTEEDFKELGHRYYTKVLMRAKLVIEELDAYLYGERWRKR